MSVFIITSVIQNALGSVVDVDTRIQETQLTIQSIKDYAKGAHIILCEGSKYSWNSIDGVEVMYCNVDGMNKNVGEASLIHHALTSDVFEKTTKDNDIHKVFKISGRYYLTHQFNMMDHVHNKITIRRNASHEPGYFCTVTVLYSFPVMQKSYLIECMQRIIQDPSLPRNIEHEIFGYTTLDDDVFHIIPELGVSGRIAPCGASWSG